MNKNVAVAVLVFSLGCYGIAGSDYYVCGKVNGVDQWSIDVDLKTNNAAFFDNNAWSVLPIHKIQHLKSDPSQKIYIFEGEDMNGQKNSRLEIHFNETRLMASIIVEGQEWSAEEGCREMPYPKIPLGGMPDAYLGIDEEEAPNLADIPDEVIEDDYADRPDVAGFIKKPIAFFLPFWKELEAVHPKAEGAEGDKNVIVIDLDEIAASGSSSGSGASGGDLATVIGESLLLGGSGILAFWYGTRTSIESIIEATNEIEELGEQRKALKLALSQLDQQDISSEARGRIEENIATIFMENRQGSDEAQFQRIFLGFVPAVGATTAGVSAFLQVPLYATAAMAAAGILGMSIAGPIITVFASASAAKHGYRFYKTLAVSEQVDKLISTASPQELEAYRLLNERLAMIQKVSAANNVFMLSLAVGIPLTIFGGAYGLAVLLPGALGSIVGSYIQGRKVNYSPQLTWEDKVRIDGKDALINLIDIAHKEYTLLKKMKSEQRLLYPIGKSAPSPFSDVVRGIAHLRRTFRTDLGYMSAEETFFTYLSQHNILEIQAEENTKTSLDKQYAEFLLRHPEKESRNHDEELIEAEILAKIAQSEHKLKELRLEDLLLKRALERPLSDEESIFDLVRFLIKGNLYLPFAQGIMENTKLRRKLRLLGVITKDDEEYHVDANKLVFLMLDSSSLSGPARQQIRQKLFKKGQDTLFITAKNRAAWRQRQLLDFLAARLVMPTP